MPSSNISTLPPSPVSNRINVLGAVCAVAAFFACRHQGGMNPVIVALLVAGAYGAVILLLEAIFLRTPWRVSTGLDFSRRPRLSARFLVRLVGVYGSWGFVLLLYWLFPEYGTYYIPYWQALTLVAPYVVALALIYVFCLDGWMKEPLDGYYWFGRLLLLKWNGMPWRMVGQHLLGWVVKGFFLPLMFVAFAGNMQYLMGADYSHVRDNIPLAYHAGIDVLFSLDLLGAVAGYVLALRLFDTHFRSAEPTAFGWIVCIMCYQPFLSVFMRLYLANNNDEFSWIGWMAGNPVLEAIWAGMGLASLIIYASATINFGCRFSNLTHRGILTNGMYRFSKHPAYLSKNFFWWVGGAPFAMQHGSLTGLRDCLLLAGVSTVYFLRAKTEERHLSRDPDYVAYALWINEHGVLRWIGRLLPFLRYRAPEGWERFPRPYTGIK